MANEMCDSELLVKISGGIDLVAIEGKYNLSSLTNYRYRYCAFIVLDLLHVNREFSLSRLKHLLLLN